MAAFIRNVIVAVALVTPAADLAVHWSSFPAVVPMHFGVSGKPDGWGPRWTLALLPVVQLVIVSLLTVGKQFPKYFNYPVRVTDENRARQQSFAIELLDQLRVVVAVMLGYISIQQMRTALGLTNGLGVWFLSVVIVAMVGTLGTYFVRAIRAR